MKTIHKFPFSVEGNGVFDLMMPEGAVIIAVQMQRGVPCLWAIVESLNVEVRRSFKIHGTGHDIGESPGRYVATFQTSPFVWHLFELD